MGGRNDNKDRETLFDYASDSISLEYENRLLKETVNQLREEVERFKSPPLMVCDIHDVVNDKAIIRIPNGNKFFVNISNSCKNIRAGHTVLVDQKNLNVIEKIDQNKNFNVEKFVIIEKPDITWEHIGGLNMQMDEIKEVIELPLKNPKLFKDVGIQPPKGLLLYGPPGTGKTLLAKAVANSTNSTFIEVVASELVQKFIGEGAKLVKEIFELAKEKAPSIIYIDELDALAATRVELGTSGEREVQRTFMQFLAEIDGFKHLGSVKVIGCTNRKDILDPAILRPGRLDRLIEVPLPDKEGIKQIFKIHTKDMNLDKKINLEKVFREIEEFSGAEIKSVCTEAGYFAIRNKRKKVTEKDFLDAIKKVKKDEADTEFTKMFG
jgi:proteasome regulatory subunit